MIKWIGVIALTWRHRSNRDALPESSVWIQCSTDARKEVEMGGRAIRDCPRYGANM
jgi:hypothetical protein